MGNAKSAQKFCSAVINANWGKDHSSAHSSLCFSAKFATTACTCLSLMTQDKETKGSTCVCLDVKTSHTTTSATPTLWSVSTVALTALSARFNMAVCNAPVPSSIRIPLSIWTSSKTRQQLRHSATTSILLSTDRVVSLVHALIVRRKTLDATTAVSQTAKQPVIAVHSSCSLIRALAIAVSNHPSVQSSTLRHVCSKTKVVLALLATLTTMQTTDSASNVPLSSLKQEVAADATKTHALSASKAILLRMEPVKHASFNHKIKHSMLLSKTGALNAIKIWRLASFVILAGKGRRCSRTPSQLLKDASLNAVLINSLLFKSALMVKSSKEADHANNAKSKTATDA